MHKLAEKSRRLIRAHGEVMRELLWCCRGNWLERSFTAIWVPCIGGWLEAEMCPDHPGACRPMGVACLTEVNWGGSAVLGGQIRELSRAIRKTFLSRRWRARISEV